MPRRYFALLSLTILAGAWLRLWQLATIPPGLHYDAAAYALLSREVAFEGYRPIFVASYAGREVLFIYWVALWYRLIGSSIFTLRLAATLVGVITLPASFFALRQVLRRDKSALPLAVFGTVLASGTLFHVIFSRFGFRVITQPLMQCLAIGFLFRGLWGGEVARPGGWKAAGDFALAGIFTGLTAHTYVGARFFVLPVGLFWLILLSSTLLTRRAAWQRSFLGFGLFALCALAVFAPLGLYFVQHPSDFFIRASQVLVRPNQLNLLGQSALKAAGMIFLQGDPYYRYNVVGQPLLGPFAGVLFIIGLLATAWSFCRAWGKASGRPQLWTTEITLLAWLPLMLLPAIVSVNEILPSNVRAFGVIPLLFAFPARGLGAVYRWLRERVPWPALSGAYFLPGVSLLVLGAGTVLTGRTYFVTWLNQPNQYLENEADLTHLGEYLNQQSLGDTALYVSALHYQHPTIAYLAHNYDAIRWLTGGTSLAIPQNQAALYLFPRSAPPPAAWIAAWTPYSVSTPPGSDPDAPGVPDFAAYRFEAGQTPPLPDLTSLSENFANIIFLEGYRIEKETDYLNVDLRWHVENMPDTADLLPYVRLYDASGAGWSQSGNFTYPSSQWAVGNTLLTRHRVPVPAGWPPGTYTLKAGLYAENEKISLPHLSQAGAFAGERAALGELWLPGNLAVAEAAFRAQNSITPPASNVGLEKNLALLGYAGLPASLRQGERLPLILYWYAREAISAEALTITLGGQALFTGQPVQNTFPFQNWQAGQAVLDRYQLRLPPNLPPGPAELRIVVPGYGTALLTTVDVLKVERQFTAPAAGRATSYDFQGLIALKGCTFSAGVPASVSLVWQSLKATGADYTVFVHVLDAAGQIVAQADAMPQGGAYPTSLWTPGEYVSDVYTFDLSPGEYTLEVGLYLPETGERLPVTSEKEPAPDDKVLIPGFEVP